MSRVQSFPPIFATDARVLVLGSMPGVESLRQQRYYAHPRNAFWPIMAELFGFDPELEYDDRVARLGAHRVALWDVLAHCVRPGSLDADIVDEVPNDFDGLLARCTNLRTIAFNGQKAATAFKKHVAPGLAERLANLQLATLPSTSPAHAGMTRAEKLRRWSVVADRSARPEASAPRSLTVGLSSPQCRRRRSCARGRRPTPSDRR